jgi:catechol 2,3-dioxygenase-like lactoylglutathione lyase family enzyme
MKLQLGQVAVVVADYDDAIRFYTEKLGFELSEDTRLSDTKRWVVATPPGSACSVLLAKAATPQQFSAVGNQTGGRVFLFLYTDDIARDFKSFSERGVIFVREPAPAEFGTAAVFKDLYGNLWDLIERH